MYWLNLDVVRSESQLAAFHQIGIKKSDRDRLRFLWFHDVHTSKLTPTNYISLEREFIEESDSF